MQIIVAGNSAGGLATLLWVNYIKDRAKTKNVRAISGSGIFLDSPQFKTDVHSYRESFINLLKISNTDADPPITECSKAHPT